MGPKNLKNKYNFKNKLKNEKNFTINFLKMRKKLKYGKKKSKELKKYLINR